MENIHARTTCIVTLAFLSVKKTILLNWKIHKPDSYLKHNRLKVFLDLLLIESAASTRKDYDNGLGAPWTLIREYMNNRIKT